MRVLDGGRYVAYFGDTSAVDQRYVAHYHPSLDAAWTYLEGSPQGTEGIAEGLSPKVCLWRRYDIGRGAAQKPWSQLTERTKEGYRTRMRAQLGIRSERDFARFHATADSQTLKWLRRHGPAPEYLVVGPGGEALTPSRSGDWVTTWEQKRGSHRRPR